VSSEQLHWVSYFFSSANANKHKHNLKICKVKEIKSNLDWCFTLLLPESLLFLLTEIHVPLHHSEYMLCFIIAQTGQVQFTSHHCSRAKGQLIDATLEPQMVVLKYFQAKAWRSLRNKREIKVIPYSIGQSFLYSRLVASNI